MSSSDALDGPQTAIFIQDACYQHRFIRSRDTSHIVERPERLRAVKVGLSAALSRLQELPATDAAQAGSDPDDLATALGGLKIEATDDPTLSVFPPKFPVAIKHSSASVDILNNEAVKFVHGDIEGDVYLLNLKKWILESVDKVEKGESEIPEGYSQGDLYLCPESLNAISGALGTVCEAVDNVIGEGSSLKRAFVAIRPPGHHCGEDSPSGFCFVNNVAVAAAHAHLKYGIKRVVIFDIDLHHGNGTQSIVWQINEETYRQTLESESGAPTTKLGPRVYYGSLHDILSYPCEDGKTELVQAASVSIHGSHGQYIENVHLQTYDSEEHFWNELYAKKYTKILRKAEEFLEGTGGPGDDVLVFISCGMDACEHEYSSMSRHNRKVPTSFYYRFTRDACAFSERYAKGRLVSVLEGGYSDRALMSGSMAHLCGLMDMKVDEEWWGVENLEKLEKSTKKRRGGRSSIGTTTTGTVEPWLERTQVIFSILEPNTLPSRKDNNIPLGPTSMTLRQRKKPSPAPSPKVPSTNGSRKVSGKVGGGKVKVKREVETQTAGTEKRGGAEGKEVGHDSDISSSSLSSVPDDVPGDDEEDREPQSLGLGGESASASAPRKIPRVILKLGPSPKP